MLYLPHSWKAWEGVGDRGISHKYSIRTARIKRIVQSSDIYSGSSSVDFDDSVLHSIRQLSRDKTRFINYFSLNC